MGTNTTSALIWSVADLLCGNFKQSEYGRVILPFTTQPGIVRSLYDPRVGTGGAGSGESEIRRWIIENDWLEAIVALPTDMFYNTGIATYVWLVTNHKAPERRGKIQLINASDFYQKRRKSLGSKRKELGEADHKALSAEIMGLLQEVTA